MSKEPKDKPELKATLEIIEEEPKTVREPEAEMTAEEIAVAEREKAQLLAGLLANAAAKRSERVVTPESAVSVSEPVFVPPTPELQAMAADVDEITAELQELEQQNKTMVKARAAAVAADEATHKARVAALNEKRNAADAKARELRLLQANAELTLLTEQHELEAARQSALAAQSRQEKDNSVRDRVQPLYETARRVRAELDVIFTEHLPTLKRLYAANAPMTWPGALQKEFWETVVTGAEKRLSEFRRMLIGLDQTIVDAEKILARGWSDDATFPADLRHVVQDLGLAAEYVRNVRESLAELTDKLHSIFERGGGVADVPDLARATSPAREVQAMAAHAKEQAQEIVETQTRATV